MRLAKGATPAADLMAAREGQQDCNTNIAAFASPAPKTQCTALLVVLDASPLAFQLYWTRDGRDWVLKLRQRKLGRVFADDRHPGMWRSHRADGRLSDMANLSWAKNAVLLAAEREIGGAE